MLSPAMSTSSQLSSHESNPYWGTLSTAAQSRPEAVALRIIDASGAEGPPHTYAEMRDCSLAAAAFLQGVGVGEGSIVLTAVANTDASVSLSIGVARLGAVWAPADQDLTLEQTMRLLQLYAPAAAFLTDQGVEALSVADADFAHTRILGMPTWQALMGCSGQSLPLERPIADGAAALMLLTSGTTGNPKSVVTPTSTLRKLAHGVGIMSETEAVTSDTAVYFGSPAWISYSMIFLSSANAQKALVLGQGYTKEIYFEAVLRHRPSSLFFWPEVVVDFAVLAAEQQQCIAGFAKALGYGGARTPSAALLKLINALPSTSITQGYASSELLPIARLSPEDHANVREAAEGPDRERALRRLQSAGKPVSQVRVVDEQGEPVPAHVTGSIHVLPSDVSRFTEYYKNPAATAAKWTADGWFITGDLGRLDEDGYLYIDGRDSETIVLLTGDNVYPNEVESVVAELPGVVEVAVAKVVAGDDAISEVGAFIRVVEGATLTVADVKAQCQLKMGQTWTHPTHIFIQTEKLPRNRNGKCMKALLSEQARASLKGLAKVGGA